MKRTLGIVLLALAVPALAQTQKAATAAPAGGTTQTLTAMESAWGDALAKPDLAALDAILAGSYIDTDEHGQRTDKKGVLAVLGSGDLKITSITLSDIHVHTYGGAAVVTGAAAQAGTYKGQSINGKVVFTDTFVKQNGKWRAVASHRSAT